MRRFPQTFTRALSVLVLLICIVLFSGCGEKDELTKPAAIDCSFQLKSLEAMGGKLIFEEGIVSLTEIEIDGERTGEDDLFFNRNFTDNGIFKLIGSDSNQPERFDIPQGAYDRLLFDLGLFQDDYQLLFRKKNEDDDDEDDDNDLMNKHVPDLDHYFENASPSLYLKARYQNLGKKFNVLISVNDILKLSLTSKQDGSRTVVLSKDRINKAFIEFNPDYWFGLISDKTLEQAEKQRWNDEKTVFIHRDFNEDIYIVLAGRIEESTEMNFSP